MTGEQLGQARIRRDLARQTAEQSDLTVQDIERSYAAQIDALTRPPRVGHSPD